MRNRTLIAVHRNDALPLELTDTMTAEMRRRRTRAIDGYSHEVRLSVSIELISSLPRTELILVLSLKSIKKLSLKLLTVNNGDFPENRDN